MKLNKAMSPLVSTLFVCRVVLCAWVCAFAFQVNADDSIKNLIPIPKFLNGGDQTNSQKPHQSLLGNVSQEEINSCIESTCGDARANWSISDALEPRKIETLEYKAIWNDRVAPLFKNAIQLEQKQALKMLERFEMLLKSKAQPPKQSPFQAYAAYADLTKKYLSKASQAVTLEFPSMRYKVKEEAVTEMINLAPLAQERAALKVIFDQVYRPMIERTSLIAMASHTNPLMVRLNMIYPKASNLTEALKLDGANLLGKARNLKKVFGVLLTSRIVDGTEMGLLIKASKGTDLSKGESVLYLIVAQRIELMAPIANRDLFLNLMSLPLNLEENLRSFEKKDLIAQRRSKILLRTVESRMDQATQVCRARLGIALASTASPLGYRKLSEIISEVKSAAKVVANELIEADAQTTIAAAIDKVEFIFPDDPMQNLTDLELNIKNEINKSQIALGALGSKTTEADDLLLVAGPLIFESVDLDDSDTISSHCDKIALETASDYTLTAKGKISLSWFTAVYRDVGMGIIGHEIGHVVSQNLRTIGFALKKAPKFLESLNCVAQRNPFVMTPSNLDYTQNTEWSEEDWADYFSSKVLNEMMKTPNSWAQHSKNLGCAIVDDNGSTYGKNIPETKPNDAHSPSFLRMLMISVDRNRVAPSCQKFLSYSRTNNRRLICSRP